MPAKKSTPKIVATKASAATTAKKAPAKKAAKKTAKKVAKKAAVKKTATKKPVAKVSPETIAHAAYLNYRRRMDLGLPGDHDSDWLEAVKSISGK
jgi:microcystin-dependent protein